MVQCYHHECDNLQNLLTDENIQFLGKTADAITVTINTLSEPSGIVDNIAVITSRKIWNLYNPMALRKAKLYTILAFLSAIGLNASHDMI